MRTSYVSRHTPLAAAILATLQTAAMHVQAAETAEPQQLPKISVGAAAEEDVTSYKRDVVSSPKYAEPLIDIPQNIAVVTRQVIDDQKLLSLRDVLSTVPGITFGAGEGGGGYGDSLTLRGFAGSNDITTDGIRDSAQYTRSDTFNLEQVEVINGANSVYSGAGAVGGTVNLVNKLPTLNSFSRIGVAAGTDSYGRVTGDVNQTLGETTAVRMNVMAHQNDVPRTRRRDDGTLGRGSLNRIRPGYRHLAVAGLSASGRREHSAIRRAHLPRTNHARRQIRQLLRLQQYRHPGNRRRQLHGSARSPLR